MECCQGSMGYNAPHDRPRRGFRASGGRDLGRGNGTMVNSNYKARKLIDELDAKDTFKVL